MGMEPVGVRKRIWSWSAGWLSGAPSSFQSGKSSSSAFRLDHGAREDVVTHLWALFEDDDADLLAALLGELLDLDGRTQTGGATADDDDVDLVRDTLDGRQVERLSVALLDGSGATSHRRCREGAREGRAGVAAGLARVRVEREADEPEVDATG